MDMVGGFWEWVYGGGGGRGEIGGFLVLGAGAAAVISPCFAPGFCKLARSVRSIWEKTCHSSAPIQ